MNFKVSNVSRLPMSSRVYKHSDIKQIIGELKIPKKVVNIWIQWCETDRLIKIFECLGYKYSHAELKFGHQRKNVIYIDDYNGIYGRGFIIETHSLTKFKMHNVIYMIWKED